MIILNEREWAENAVATHELGKYPAETLARVAKYYRHALGYKKSEVRRKMDEFLIACEPNTVLIKWSDMLDRIVKNVDKYSLVEINSINVTDGEMRTIATAGLKQDEKLLFVYLCIAKYWNYVNEDNNNWVNTDDAELMRMANISPGLTRQNKIVHRLRDLGFIDLNKKVNSLNIQVKYINDDSDTVLRVYDFRNLGNQYLKFRGDKYFFCSSCGLCVRKTGNAQKYCKQCATESYIKKSVESVMKKRIVQQGVDTQCL